MTPTGCPRCTRPTVSLGTFQPWCPSGEWHLDRVAPATFGWRLVDRPLIRVASRRTAAQFAALPGGAPASARIDTELTACQKRIRRELAHA